MTDKKFRSLILKIIAEHYNGYADKAGSSKITEDDVFIVWQCKTLQNFKALAATTVPDGIYYEITYNGDKDEVYIDVYKNWENFEIENVAEV